MAQVTISSFIGQAESFSYHIGSVLEERSASIESATVHLIETVTNGYSHGEKQVVQQSKQELLTAMENEVQEALAAALITSLRKFRLRVASGVGGTFIFLEPPMFKVAMQLKIPDVVLNPPLETIQFCINKVAKIMLFTTKKVYRWSARRAG